MNLSTACAGVKPTRPPAAGRIALIGVGGVASGADAYAKIRAGARAVQLYSAMVFAGPGLSFPAIQRDLSARLEADGFKSVAEAVGASWPPPTSGPMFGGSDRWR